jgi:hypothetical protein
MIEPRTVKRVRVYCMQPRTGHLMCRRVDDNYSCGHGSAAHKPRCIFDRFSLSASLMLETSVRHLFGGYGCIVLYYSTLCF